MRFLHIHGFLAIAGSVASQQIWDIVNTNTHLQISVDSMFPVGDNLGQERLVFQRQSVRGHQLCYTRSYRFRQHCRR